jgi:hypothetical protein
MAVGQIARMPRTAAVTPRESARLLAPRPRVKDAVFARYAALFRRTPPPSVSITLFKSLTQA